MGKYIKIEVEGITYATTAEALRHYDTSRQLVDARLKLGWSVDKAFTEKVRGWGKMRGGCDKEEWDDFIKQWGVPGFKTYSPREMENYFGKPDTWFYYRLWKYKGKLSEKEYSNLIAPYWMPHVWRKKGQGGNSHFLENRRGYEDAIMRLVDAGHSKEFVTNLFIKAVKVLKGPSQARIKKKLEMGQPIHEYSITPLELILVWPLDDACPICSTKMKVSGESTRSRFWHVKKKYNEPPKEGTHKNTPNPDSASVDRKENEREYESGNCGWVCWQCNRAKGTLTAEEADRIAAWIRTAHRSIPGSLDNQITVYRKIKK